MRFAAIDVGSNAVRLLLTQVMEFEGTPFFKKDSLIRIPIRLGEEAFLDHVISQEKIEKLVSTMTGFKHLIDAYKPLNYIACATSAMREAENGNEIVERIRTQSHIELEIVDGRKEAETIFSNHSEQLLNSNESYIYIDVGGGSTELTVFSNGKSVESMSFQIGTIRMLENLVPASYWIEMKKWIKKNTKNCKKIGAIGSGGNINKIFRLAVKKINKPISYGNINKIYKSLKNYSFEDRIKILNLRPDRADVIVPAAQIYLAVMKWAKSKKMYVPQIGFADGLIHIMYEEYKTRSSGV